MATPIVLHSKFDQMVDILTSNIQDGHFPEGGKIPSENKLSEAYGISRNTVREAISALVRQGYLSRAQGKGTFVLARQPKLGETTHTYAIFLQAHSHVFDCETRALVRAFQRQKALPIVFDVDDITSDKQADAILLKLLEQGVDGMVLHSHYIGKLDRVCKQSGHAMPPVAIVNYSDDPLIVPTKQIFSDFRAGTAMATRHLLEQGRRRILFLTHHYCHAPEGTPLAAIHGIYGDTIRGYADTMAEAGLADSIQYFLIDNEFSPASGERERLLTLLQSPHRPDAVLAFGDYRAKHVLAVADQIGLKVPDDLSIVGYWNTPWAELSRLPLTSVSIRENEIARLAAKQLMHAHQQGVYESTRTIVPPELILRASSATTSNP